MTTKICQSSSINFEQEYILTYCFALLTNPTAHRYNEIMDQGSRKGLDNFTHCIEQPSNNNCVCQHKLT